MNAKVVVLDRDGVINEDSDDYIKSADEWRPIPGACEAIGAFTRAGYRVAVATNQSGLGRGYFDEAALQAMHDKMRALVAEQGGRIDAIAWCPHLPHADCDCRKPRIGLLDQLEGQLGQSLKDAWFVGDSEKDLDCALAKGCRPALVLTGKGGDTYLKLSREKLDLVQVFDDLLDASRFILALASTDALHA